ncbi:MAG: hypothetical protein P4L39_03350 [Humidesulfovibrio sp.]|nr:hypothetical protein [Humidesulfovibrio sp.]
MKRFAVSCCVVAAIMLSGCARLDFGKDKGLTYYEAKPYLLVSVSKGCVPTASVLMLPAEKKQVRFVSGLGGADLTVALNNGMITNVGQKTDTVAPAALTSLVGLATALPPLLKSAREGEEKPAAVACPQAVLYPIEDGVPDWSKPNGIPLLKNPTRQ